MEFPRRNTQLQQNDVAFSGVPWVLTSEQRRGEDRRGSKVRHPGRRFSQMSISPLNPLFSRGHPLFTCWLCGCVLRLQTRGSRGLSPVSWLLLALQTPSKGDTCAARLCFFFCEGWESILELEEFWPAAPGSWKLPLCLLLSACKNNSRLIYSSSPESWPCVRTLAVLFPRCQMR